MIVVLCPPSPAARREKQCASPEGSCDGPGDRTLMRPGGDAGFTLPELLIVVGIIVVLLAILMPTVAAARNRAKAVVCLSNVRQLCLGMTAYAATWDHQ